MLLFLKEHELVMDEAISDYQVSIDYMTMVGKDIEKYATADERIIIR